MSRRTRNTDGEAISFSATMRPSKVGQPRRVDFYTLPRPVQERFAAATRRTAPPAPLLFKPAPRTTVWSLLGGSGLLLIVAALVMRAGWGDVESSLALHGVKMVAVDLLLLAGAVYGVVHAMSILKASDSLPYVAGTYVFPACVVEASGRMLRVWSVSDAEALEVVSAPSPGLALIMREGGGRVVAPAASRDEAERAQKALNGLRASLAKATAESDPHVLAQMDPLHDSAISSPIGPSERMAYSLPAWTRVDWAIAAGIGVALGLIMVESRNALSDEAMFRSVTASASAPALQAYLTQAGKHSPDVRDILLPRVELAMAEATGSAETVKAFAVAHAGSKIQPEIDAALRRLLLAELDKAKKVGTVSALDAFIQQFPDSGLGPELGAARHALYQQALAAWRKKASPDAPTSAFVERLLASAEKAGNATCEVRFRQQTSKTLDDADQRTKKDTHYPGPDALPSRYVTTAALRQREERAAQDLVTGFAADFPADVLALKAGDPLAGDADPPSLRVPTLVVTYAPEWSHANTLCLRPVTLLSGINFAFDATFSLPDGAPYTVKTKAWRGAELWKMKTDGMARVELEQKVYDAMMDGAFDQLGKKLSDTFL